MMVLYIVVAVVAAALALNALNRRRTDDLRQTGFVPPPGQGSDADVERLVALGQKIDAIKLYRDIHGTGLKTAKDAVDKIAEKPALGGRARDRRSPEHPRGAQGGDLIGAHAEQPRQHVVRVLAEQRARAAHRGGCLRQREGRAVDAHRPPLRRRHLHEVAAGGELRVARA